MRNLLAILLMLSLSTQAFSYEEDRPYTFWLNLGVGINAMKSGTVSGTAFKFQPEANAGYYFTENVGLFTGLGYTTYSMEPNSGQEFTVSYLDIPVGVSFKYQNGFIQNANSMFNLGVYFGLPLTDLELNGSKAVDASTPVGLYIGGITAFDVTDDFKLGFGSTLKFAFTDVVETPSNSALSIGFNIVLIY